MIINILEIRDAVLDKYMPIYLLTYVDIDRLQSIEEAMYQYTAMEDGLTTMVIEELLSRDLPIIPAIGAVIHTSILREMEYYFNG
jgi:hypothetical protein